jgi:hypothetical protein
MSDEPHKTNAKLRAGRAAAWIAFVLFVVYPASALPAVIAGEWLIRWGAISSAIYRDAFNTAYAPVLWAIDHSTALQWADEFFNRNVVTKITPR